MAASSGSGAAAPALSTYIVTNLVSDGAVPALHTDAKLQNAWGIAFNPIGPVWIADNGSNVSTLYIANGLKFPLTVTIPAGSNGPANPTGLVYHAGSGFNVKNGLLSGPSQFLFAGEGGTISGWGELVNPLAAITAYDDGAGGAVYKGVALADNNGAEFLYATDFHNNKIDVFDASFNKQPAGGFQDPGLPAGYAPFGIQSVGGMLVVTYAMQMGPQNHDEVDGAGLGYVDLFDPAGNLVRRIGGGGVLNSPWGVAMAPAGFGSAGSALLVGNFGDGRINAFNLSSGQLLGTLADASGQPIVIDGLWGLAFGDGLFGQPTSALFFAAGPNGEADGLYGRIDAGASAPAPQNLIAITSPMSGATVSGTVPVSASVQDMNAVSQVQFTAAGAAIGTATAAPFTVQWNTTAAANGSVALVATATDSAGNTLTSPAVSVTVDNGGGTPPPASATTLTELQMTFFTPICSVCHTGMGSSLPGSQNLTAGNTFSNIVNVASVEVPSLDRIKPNDPTNSYLIQKIEGASGIVGERMPFGCSTTSSSNPCLTQAQINEFISWVNSGAPNN